MHFKVSVPPKWLSRACVYSYCFYSFDGLWMKSTWCHSKLYITFSNIFFKYVYFKMNNFLYLILVFFDPIH